MTEKERRAPHPDTAADPPLGDVLFEYHVVGRAIRVAAIDVATNTEVVIMGAVGTSETALQGLALRRLRQALKRRPATG